MLIAHNANYACIFLLKYISNEKPLVKGSRILSCNAVYYRYGNLHKKIYIQINIYCENNEYAFEKIR